jgi:CubicO group peptidase (beta-lactamase class C family)
MRRYLLLVGLLLAGGASAQTAQTLPPGDTRTATLQPGEQHVYLVEAAADWFVSGRVDQHGVDVTVTITGPGDEQVARFDRAAMGAHGPEHFRFTTERPGAHRIEVAAAEEASAGRYTIRLRRAEPVATEPGERLDQLMAMFDDDTPGAVVAVMRGGEIDFVRSYGSANLAHGVRFTPQTPTNIGSTSKQFTGFALALLADRGIISLEDDVREHIPELPDFGHTITLRNLLTHTTGFREYINTLLLGGRRILEGDYIARDEVIEVVQRQPELQNEPGTEFNYNNTAFHLATVVVERATGRSFPEWMAEEVFGPLGMHNTVVRAHPGQVIPNSSVGYTVAEGGYQEARDLWASMGAGGMYTTPGDLARWMRNLRTGELGGENVRREMTTPNVLQNGESTNYSLGLFIDEDAGLSRWQHGGSDVAHRSHFYYYPTLDAGYVVLSNHAAIPGSIAREVAELFFGEHMTREPAPDEAAQAFDPDLIPSEVLDAYVGRYELEPMPGFVLEVRRDDDGLLVEPTGQPATRLIATSDSTFTLEGADASVTFHVEEDGVNALTLHQSGNHRARRMTDAEAVDLEPYVGRYFSAELETHYTVVLEDGELSLQHRRFEPVSLSHAEGDTFTGSLPVVNVRFTRDATGRVTGIRVGNGRARDVAFERIE